MINTLILPEFLVFRAKKKFFGGEDVSVLSVVKWADLIQILFKQQMENVAMVFQWG